jgi:transposase
MPNILIRNVPPEVHARLTAAAKENGQSLQQYVLDLISIPGRRMSHAETIAWLRTSGERLGRHRGSAEEPKSGAEIIREGRIERTQQMYDRWGLPFDAREDFE